MSIDELNPNVLALVLAGVGTVATWLWSKVTGRTQQSATELLGDVVDHVLAELLQHPAALAVARERLEEECLKALSAIGITRSAAKKLVRVAVERGVAKLRTALNVRAAQGMPAQVDELATAAARAGTSFEPSGDFPRLDVDIKADPR